MSPKGRGNSKTPRQVVELLNEEVARSSQAATARATGLTLQTVQRYIKGIGEPTTATLQRLADYFGVDVDYLTGQGLYRFKEMSLDEAREFKKNTDPRTIQGQANLFRTVAGIIAGKDEGSVDYNALRANDFEHWTDSLRGMLRSVLPQFDEKEVVLVGNQMIDMVNAEVDAVVKEKAEQRSNLSDKLGIDPQEAIDKLKELGYEITPTAPLPK